MTQHREAAILAAMAKASLKEQRALAQELEAIRAIQRTAATRESDELLSEAVYADLLTPKVGFTAHTASTDWMLEATPGHGSDDRSVHVEAKAEATKWVQRVSAAAKADRDEFTTQAQGYARTWGSQFGLRSSAAAESFLAQAMHLAGFRRAEASRHTAAEAGASHEAVELELFLMNDHATYSGQYTAVVKNLEKFYRKGQWDHNRAVTGMMYAVDTAAQNYTREFGTPGGNSFGIFSKDIRKEVAESLVKQLEEEMGLGNFMSSRSARRHTAADGTCAECGKPVGPLEQFPNANGSGILCLDCYANSPEGRRMPTADEVVEMWGGPVRRASRKTAGPPRGSTWQERDAYYANQFASITSQEAADMNSQWRSYRDYYDAKQAFVSASRTDSRGLGVAFAYISDLGVYRVWSGEISASRKNASLRITAARPLYEIASDIRKDWRATSPNWRDKFYGAVPYLEAMDQLNSINDSFFSDSGKMIVAYFLSNATSWRGETAKQIKAELKAMMNGKDASLHTAADTGIYCPRCKGKQVVNMGGVWRNCTKCGGSGLNKKRVPKDVMDIIGEGSLHTADQGFGPDENSQSGYAESQLPWVDVSATDNSNLGWIDDDPEGANEMAPAGSVGPFDARRRTAAGVYANYGWVIDKSYIEDDDVDNWGKTQFAHTVNIVGPQNIHPKVQQFLLSGKGEAFKLYDDDDTLYYSGRWVDDAVAAKLISPSESEGDYEGNPLEDFGTPNAGAAYMTNGRGGRGNSIIGSRRTAADNDQSRLDCWNCGASYLGVGHKREEDDLCPDCARMKSKASTRRQAGITRLNDGEIELVCDGLNCGVEHESSPFRYASDAVDAAEEDGWLLEKDDDGVTIFDAYCPDCAGMMSEGSLRRQADEGYAGNLDGTKPAGAAPMIQPGAPTDVAMFEPDELDTPVPSDAADNTGEETDHSPTTASIWHYL